MGKGTDGRDLYFDKHIRHQPTSEAYVKALAQSPYRTHRRAAIEIIQHHKQLTGQEYAIKVQPIKESDDGTEAEFKDQEG